MLGCNDEGCLAELADAFGATWIASARVSQVGKTIVVGVSFFDRTTAAAAQKGQVVANRPEEVQGAVKATVAQMAARLASKVPRSKPVVVDRGVAGLDFVEVSGGTVFVGCASGDADCNTFEARQRVELSSFAAMKTEVTVAQFSACVRAGACVSTSRAASPNCNAGVNGREKRPHQLCEPRASQSLLHVDRRTPAYRRRVGARRPRRQRHHLSWLFSFQMARCSLDKAEAQLLSQ